MVSLYLNVVKSCHLKCLFKIILLIILFFTYPLSSQNSHPQEPKEPLEYVSEDIAFLNAAADSISLAGTLTLPESIKKPPVVILISGSGPQNRNEESQKAPLQSL